MTGDKDHDLARSLELSSRRHGQTLVLAFAGELDMAATFKLEPQLDRLFDAPDLRHVECDLAGVTFVDSAGLGLLLALQQRARDRGIAMTIVSVSAPVRRILALSGLADVITDDPA